MKRILPLFLLAICSQTFAQPSISSFSPASGPVGASITIDGTNFNPVAANNTVYFGATIATVTAASPTQLTVTVPVGATWQPITVTVSGLTAFSQKPFVLTFPNGGVIDGCALLTPPQYFTGAINSRGLDVGDLDGDGKVDAVTSSNNIDAILIFRNNNTAPGSIIASTFETPIQLAVGQDPEAVKLADIDGDGKLDIVVTSATDNIVSIFRNISTSGSLGAGSFAPRFDYSSGSSGPWRIVCQDLDLDGRTDLAVANNFGNSIGILRNIGTPGTIDATTFAPVFLLTGHGASAFEVADFDVDGRPDFMVGHSIGTQMGIIRNISSPGSLSAASFAPRVDFAAGAWLSYTAVGDLDNDNKPDVITVSVPSAQFSIHKNTSTPGTIDASSFAPQVVYNTAVTEPSEVTIADMDGDGKPDIVLPNYVANSVSLYKNVSTTGVLDATSFSPGVPFSGIGNTSNILTADIDGDGRSDVINTHWNGVELVVLRNTASATPTVTALAPVAEEVGSTVTLTGSFAGVPTDNTVYLGATKASILNATPTQLLVTVPHGATYEPVSALGGCKIGYSRIPFVPTFEGDNVVNASTFASKVDFTTGAGSRPTDVELADFNGDGLADAVTINDQNNTVSVFRNTGSPGTVSFGARVDIGTGSSSQNLEVADIDSDGKLDIITVSDGSAQMAVHRNTSTLSTISFAARVPFASGGGSVAVATGDLDGDGKTDVVVGRSGGTIAVFRNTGTVGTINFAALQSFITGTNTYSVAVSDLDGDGKADVMASNRSSNNVSVFRNISSVGSIAFDPRFDLATSTQPHGVAAGDLDLDGKPEIITCNYTTRTVSIFRNISSSGSLSAGSFAARVDLSNGATGNPTYVAVGDLSGDGRPDILVGNDNGTLVQIHKNISSPGTITPGSFEPKVDFTTGTRPYNVISGDVDNDGKPDLVVASATSNNLTILRNASCLPAPTITNFSPLGGGLGTPVTITGTNFSPIPSNNLVAFNGVSAVVTASTPTSIATTVPAGATTGPITVTVDCNTATSASNFDVSCVPASEKAALVALYNATNGAAWTTNTNWPTGNASTWYGITTDASCHVTRIELSVNNLVGSIPPEIGDLPFLAELDLSANNLSGPLPAAITNLSALEFLVLNNNNLTGTLPTDIGSLGQLKELHTSTNAFNGSIPSSLQNCTALEVLFLENNQFSGTIPGFLGDLSNLFSINLGFNQFDGVIPPELGTLNNLQFLSLAGNQLFGSIPPELGNLGALELLDLHTNQLGGLIPSELSNLTSLLTLQLWENQLVGQIPTALGGLTGLLELNLSQNYLNGAIPPEIGSMSSLRYLNLSQNILDSQLPTELGNLLALQELYLNSNQLNSGVPVEIASLPALSKVNLSYNLFTGMNQFMSATLTDLAIEGNSLDFGDLELNIGVTNYSYDPQAKLPPGGQISFTPGSTLTIPFATPGSANSYQWLKDGTPQAGATSSTLTKPGMTTADAGFYYVQVTSAIVPGITLTSRNYVVTADPCAPGGPEGDNDPSFVPDIGGSDVGAEAVEIQSTGKIILSANGNIFSSSNVDGIFRLNADGTFDSSFPVTLPATRQMIVQPDDKILAGTSRVLRLNADGTDDAPFNTNSPSYYNAIVYAMALQPDGRILAAISEDSNPVILHRLNADGTDDGSFTGPVGYDISVIRVQADGKILLGGSFAGGIMRLNSNGTFDTSFNENTVDGSVNDIAVQSDGKIILVGLFENFNSLPNYKVVRLLTDGSEDVTFSALGVTDLLEDFSAPNRVLLQGDNKILLLGFFTEINGTPRPDIVRLLPDGSVDCTFDSQLGTNGFIQDAALQANGRILITGDFQDYNGVPNSGFGRVLSNGPTIIINPQPADAVVCDGITATFTTGATGTTNVTYQWQYSPDGVVPFVDIANGGGYSNVTSPVLSVNTAGAFGAGRYRCRINGDFAAQVVTNDEGLFINTTPAPPGGTGNTSCGGASLTLTATGSTNGNYRWYTVSSGGTALTGEVNSSYTTPVITATTTYYAAIDNGVCEGPRTAIVATIFTPPNPPTTTGASGCTTSSLTLSASGGVNGQYRWYTVATGGTPLAGEVNDTYVTPVLSVTTSYFVSIDDGACESTRSTVTAIINSPAAPTVITSNCTAVGATLTGPTGFTAYTWSNGATTPAINVTVAGSYTLVVTDAGGCSSPTSTAVVFTSAFCNQPPAFQSTTLTTTVQSTLTINVANLVTDLDNNVDLSTLQIVVQPSSGATASITTSFEILVDYSGVAFAGTDELTIRICDTSGACTDQVLTVEVAGDITIFNALSPNGDGKNDVFYIQYINALPETQQNEVTILNRWGTVVFEASNYDNNTKVFRGLGNNGEELPSGTYYYIIEFKGGVPKRTGFISLRR